MTTVPQVSVVLSVHDDAPHLRRSVDSVLAQGTGDFEFIIVNDGSPDPLAGEVLDDLAARDCRVHVLTKSNEGLTRALIDGCAIARGRYVARIDVGDVMLPSRLEQQASVLDQHPKVGFVSSWTEVCGPEWEPLYVEKGNPCAGDGEDVIPLREGETLKSGPTHHGSVMFRRDLYKLAGGYRWQFYYGQDWDLWYRLAELGGFAMVPEVLYRARLLPRGISGTWRSRQTRAAEASLGAFWSRRRGQDESEWLARAAAVRPAVGGATSRSRESHETYYLVGELMRRKRDPRCRKYFMRAIGANPLQIRSYVRLAQSTLQRMAR